MTATLELRQNARGAGGGDRPPSPRAVVRWAVLLLALTAGLVFCHGCHAGDHDDELQVVLPQRR